MEKQARSIERKRMDDRVAVWLKKAPMPYFEEWLRSLYNDNILAVSRGGENIPSAFAEYGKKLLVDLILFEQRNINFGPRAAEPIADGVEMLLGEIKSANED